MKADWRRAWTLLGVATIPLGSLAFPTGALKRDTDYDAGLISWRKPGKIDNAACANCHGPDGLELAIYNFDDATIRRRAAPHLGGEDAEKLVGLIHAVRQRYSIVNLLDPIRDRPFQPGGSVLPGKTAPERDLAFGRELEEKLPLLATGRIMTLQQAQAAADQAMALNPWDLRIGVPFNRFSEDVFHGKEHASLAHWLPDVARIIPVDHQEEWYALQDAYLANPTDDNLWPLYDAFGRITMSASPTGIVSIADAKYRSLLLLQHAFRKQRMGIAVEHPPVAFGDRAGWLVPNPMWEIGEIARRFQDMNGESMGMAPTLVGKKSGGPTFADQMHDIQSSWFWLGWLFDQGLNRTSRRGFAARGDWLALALWNGGPYPIHNLYWLTRKQLVANRVPNSWGGLPDRRRPEWDYLAMRIGGRYISDMPTEPAQRTIYKRFAANGFRMNLLLMLDEFRKSKIVWYRSASRQDVRAMTDFIVRFDPERATDAVALRDQVLAAIADCSEKL